MSKHVLCVPVFHEKSRGLLGNARVLSSSRLVFIREAENEGNIQLGSSEKWLLCSLSTNIFPLAVGLWVALIRAACSSQHN